MPDWDNYSKEMQIVNQDFNQPHGLRMNKFRDHLLQISIIVSAVSTAPGYRHFVIHVFQNIQCNMTDDTEILGRMISSHS